MEQANRSKAEATEAHRKLQLETRARRAAEAKGERDGQELGAAWADAARESRTGQAAQTEAAEIQDRRLRSAEALRKCLVLDALSAWRTFELCRPARGDPSAPASDYLSPADMLAIRAVSEEERILPQQLQGVEPPEDVRWWVLRMAGLPGLHPCKRRPLPGTEKLRQAWHLLRPMARATDVLLKTLHRQQAAAGAADRGRAWPSVPTWPDLQAARVANWSPPEQVDSERLSHCSKPA